MNIVAKSQKEEEAKMVMRRIATKIYDRKARVSPRFAEIWEHNSEEIVVRKVEDKAIWARLSLSLEKLLRIEKEVDTLEWHFLLDEISGSEGEDSATCHYLSDSDEEQPDSEVTNNSALTPASSASVNSRPRRGRKKKGTSGASSSRNIRRTRQTAITPEDSRLEVEKEMAYQFVKASRVDRAWKEPEYVQYLRENWKDEKRAMREKAKRDNMMGFGRLIFEEAEEWKRACEIDSDIKDDFSYPLKTLYD